MPPENAERRPLQDAARAQMHPDGSTSRHRYDPDLSAAIDHAERAEEMARARGWDDIAEIIATLKASLIGKVTP